MELRVLRYFLTVAREGSITAAANFLHLTQPTLSRQLKDLEEELGIKLFDRHSHHITLTADGMRLRKRAEEIIDMLQKTEAEFAVHEERIAGDVHIGGGETRVMHLLADIIRDIRRDYPDIVFHLQSGNSGDITERLDKGLLDFAVLIQPADISKYHSVNLPEKDVWGVIMRKDAPLAKKATITLKDLLDVPVILSSQAIRRTSVPNRFLDWFGDDFDRLHIAGTFNLVYNATILAESGIGYVVSLDGLANVSAESPLCFRLLEPRLETGLHIAWKKYQVFSPAAGLFLERIMQQFGAAGRLPATSLDNASGR